MFDIEPEFNAECNPGSMTACDHLTMVGLGERLQEAMEARSVSVSRLAAAVKMSYQGIKKILNGQTRGMSAANLAAISAYLSINPDWLRTGQGERDIAATPAAPRTASESQWALLEDFEILPEDEKQALRSTLKAKADHVRKIVAEYLGRQGMTGSATDARVAESYGRTPPPPPPSPSPKSGPGSYKKITPVPAPNEGAKHKAK